MGKSDRFLTALRNGGILPADSAELRLQKSLLIFATGLISLASMLWLLIYWQIGPKFSSTIPFAFQLLLVSNLLIYLKTTNFAAFRRVQLALFLIVPFVAQWSMGNFISASGVSLWGLLAPVGAILCIGARESLRWFIAYLLLMGLSGTFDFLFADTLSPLQYKVPTHTTVFFFALNFAAVSSIVYLLLRHSAIEKQKAQVLLERAHQHLQAEQERSERLLLNVLPAPIAARLKNTSETIADGFADVSVMFVDIVSFTKLAEGLNPQQVFSMLNRIFSSFDELAEKYGLEKIKTIGDAYMVAGGLSNQRSDYSDALVDMALEMRDLLRSDFQVNQMHLEVRIGIGTGPVVAGVVGKKKFIYDLWGDTVNIASRITSEGIPGMVQVDETTYRRLQQRFDFHEPQTLYLKGKGNMVVYRVVGRKDRGGVNSPVGAG